CRDF
ncbi:Chromosome partition protein MukF, partial [Haemophilus influenzae]